MLYARLEQALAGQGVLRSSGARVLVACSGGADSVALAHVAAKIYGPDRVALGHVDHGVRAGSAADAEAVRAFGAGLGLDVHVERLEGLATDEASLRDARYAALERMRGAAGAAWVLTAHSADDQAETVLLMLLSRTHADALAGMPAVRGRVLRPWLTVGREEIHAHVARHRLPVREDPSNREPTYLRNRVRKELLPLLEARYRPGLARRLAALATDLAANLAAGPSTEAPHPPPPSGLLPGPGATPDGPESAGAPPAVWLERAPWAPNASIPHGPDRAVFDAEVVDRVHLRGLRSGDRIAAFGGSARRKVRDVLREAGIPEGQRRLWYVVTDHADRVLWVPGLLRSRHALVGEKTKTVWWCGVDRNDELRGEASRATVDGAASGAYVPDREKNE